MLVSGWPACLVANIAVTTHSCSFMLYSIRTINPFLTEKVIRRLPSGWCACVILLLQLYTTPLHPALVSGGGSNLIQVTGTCYCAADGSGQPYTPACPPWSCQMACYSLTTTYYDCCSTESRLFAGWTIMESSPPISRQHRPFTSCFKDLQLIFWNCMLSHKIKSLLF